METKFAFHLWTTIRLFEQSFERHAEAAPQTLATAPQDVSHPSVSYLRIAKPPPVTAVQRNLKIFA